MAQTGYVIGTLETAATTRAGYSPASFSEGSEPLEKEDSHGVSQEDNEGPGEEGSPKDRGIAGRPATKPSEVDKQGRPTWRL
tara:strand:+ start:463 stop:708 length:246 start_codon:yes stop_codon:yes gene_type:complete